MIKKFWTLLFAILISTAAVTSFTGCQEEPVEEAVEEVGDEIDDATDDS